MGVVHGSIVVMPITLGLNIAALNTQRRLSNSSQELSTVFERLSSGQRINRASDDAAGLAISDSLRADQRVYAQGIRNLNDGVSLLNIADGALSNLSSIVIRLQELAEQSANGVYSGVQRQALNAEAQTLSDEYFRIVKSTEFNGRNLFDAEFGELRLQAGYGLSGGVQSNLGGAIGTGNFEEFSISNFNIVDAVDDFAVGDFNNDGNIDVAGIDRTGGDLQVALGTGDGTFLMQASGTGYVHNIAANLRSVETGDFNGDGILDLAAVRSDGGGTVHVLIGNGDGTFNSPASYTGGAGNRDLTIADVTGDGVLDIVSANSFSDSIGVLQGNGDGTFQSIVTHSVGVNLHELESGDLNGDGLSDIIAKHAGYVGIQLANGDGTFQAQVTYSASGSLGDVTVDDLNKDGVLDVISVGTNSEAIIHFGNGDGTFQSATTLSLMAGTFANKIVTSDFDGDGNRDLLIANYSGQGQYLFGNGDGSFDAPISLATGSAFNDVAAADINNDGVYDAVFASTFAYSSRLSEVTSGVSPLLDFDLSSMVGARQALPQFQHKIEQLSQQRGQIGAFMARLEVAANNLDVSVQSYSAAESRIRDADIAFESSRLVRLNILQQASAAVLAQANQQPALALRLLGGAS